MKIEMSPTVAAQVYLRDGCKAVEGDTEVEKFLASVKNPKTLTQPVDPPKKPAPKQKRGSRKKTQ